MKRHPFEEAHDDPAPAPNCWTCLKPRAHPVHQVKPRVALAPVKCWACGRTWMLGEALQLAGRCRVCPHARDCMEKKDRDRMVREFKRCYPLTRALPKGR